jgi:hypothetical protein
VTDDRDDGIDRKGMRRKFQAIRADQVRLRQQIKEMAAAFADDPAERQDYRHTLIYLLVADAVNASSFSILSKRYFRHLMSKTSLS